MIIGCRGRPAMVGAVLLLAAATAGCTTEYHGRGSGIDGWFVDRISSFVYPVSASTTGPLDETIAIKHRLAPDLYPPAVTDPAAYLAGIEGTRWDGSPGSVSGLGLGDGGAILYDISSTASTAQFSVFVASGARPGGEGREHPGPSEVYTCSSFEVGFDGPSSPMLEETDLPECPAVLVAELAADAAFASAEVFDG